MKSRKKRKKHPAPFNARTLDIVSFLLHMYWKDSGIPERLLDPLAGIGGVAGVEWPGKKYGVEIEREWAEQARERGLTVHIGDSRELPWPDGHFGVICTAPSDGTRAEPRMAPKSARDRNYRRYLGRHPSPGTAGAAAWGDEYRAVHTQIWAESLRVLAPGGLCVLSVTDHLKHNRRQDVAKWHLATLEKMGMEVLRTVRISIRDAPANDSKKPQWLQISEYEWVFVLRKPNTGR